MTQRHEDDDKPLRPLPADVPPVLGYQAPRSGRTSRVATCRDAGEGHMLVAELAGHGIPAAVINEHTRSAMGPFGGGLVAVQVEVPSEEEERAAEIINRLRSGLDLEPEAGPADGSTEFTVGESGERQPLVAVAEFDTAREMYDCAATLGSVRVTPFLPNVVRRPEGASPSGRKFVVRVLEEESGRAKRVLAEALQEAEEEDEPRCPACGSWHVGNRVDGLFATVARWFGAQRVSSDPVGRWQCYRCGNKF